MSILLLTMGPDLSITMDTPALRVGEAGTITLRANGAVGPVKWVLAGTDLPAEWGGIVANGNEATISTGEALEWGTFTFTVRAYDASRMPVVRTFEVRVATAEIVVAPGGTQDWIVGTPVSLPLAITGGTGVYVASAVASGSLPSGVSASIVGSNLQISGTPSSIADDAAVISVTDSQGAQGVTSLDWEVTSPPKILIGGLFNQVSGVTANRIARLNHDGTLDTSFTTSISGVVNRVDRIMVLPSGKIMVCGSFNIVNGVSKPYIVRLHADGTVDTSFVCVPGGEVRNMALQDDGKIVIVGNFISINGSSGTQRYARINEDGSTDTSFGPCSADNALFSAVALSGGRTLVSGYFTTIGGVTTSARLAVLNADGTVDASFTPAVSGPDGGYVNRFSVQSDGKILAAGRVTSIFGTAVSMVFRLNADLTLDSGWVPFFYHPNSMAQTAVQLTSGDVLVGGQFIQIWDGSAWLGRNNVGVIGASSGLPTAFNPTANGTAYVAMEMPDGNILCAGDFTTIAGSSRTRIALVTSSGTLVSGFAPTANSTVRAAALQFL